MFGPIKVIFRVNGWEKLLHSTKASLIAHLTFSSLPPAGANKSLMKQLSCSKSSARK